MHSFEPKQETFFGCHGVFLVAMAFAVRVNLHALSVKESNFRYRGFGIRKLPISSKDSKG